MILPMTLTWFRAPDNDADAGSGGNDEQGK